MPKRTEIVSGEFFAAMMTNEEYADLVDGKIAHVVVAPQKKGGKPILLNGPMTIDYRTGSAAIYDEKKEQSIVLIVSRESPQISPYRRVEQSLAQFQICFDDDEDN